MKRSIIVILTLIGGLVSIVIARPTWKVAEVSLTPDTPPVVLHDREGVFSATRRAFELAGYELTAYVGQDWRGEECSVHSYVVDPQSTGTRSILFTRELNTDEIAVLTADDFDALMRRHISFDGGFVPITAGRSELDRYYLLGRVPDDPDGSDIWVHFDRTACGMVVDRFWIRRYAKGSEYVDVRIPVLP